MAPLSDNNLKERFLSAKRSLFHVLYQSMNEPQREAIFTVQHPLLILAGAGSGKTTVLVNRIAFLMKYGNAYFSNEVPEDIHVQEIEKLEKAISLPMEDIETVLSEYTSHPCPPWAILSITFTNKAAKEMKERLIKTVGERAKDVWTGTFHSICMRILRCYGNLVGYNDGFTIYDAEDSKKLIGTCMKELNLDDKNVPVRFVQSQISRAKDKLTAPEAYMEEVGTDFKFKQAAAVYFLYQQKLREANALDFDDIIMQTVNLLRNEEEVRNYYQERFHFVCVDEYQDTNYAQFMLVLLLSNLHHNLMVVGDDDQSIYKFRGASIQNILNFDKEMKDVKVIKLEQNYRSSQNILNAANAVIRNNVGRKGKELWSDKPEGDKVIVKKLPNQHEEAKYIINKIMEMVIREKRHYNEFAVLYRVNAQSNNLETIFAKSGVPYRILGGTRFYERKEIKDCIAYLCVVNNVQDDLRLRRIINEPKRKIGEATVTIIEQLALQENVSMFAIIETVDQYAVLSKMASKLREFGYLIRKLQKIAETEKVSVLIENMLRLTGYREMLVENKEEEADRLENIQELISNAMGYEAKEPEATLSGFLEEVALVSDIDNYDDTADAVVLMTIHSSKGLEFPVVFLPGMEDGVFPTVQSAMYPDDLEEERRLAYVAITRAKERLFAIHVKERLLYGRTQYNPITRFITEIPPEYIDEDIPKPKPQDIPIKPEKKKRSSISQEFLSRADSAKEVGRNVSYERFREGDLVSHMTFGKGNILSVRQMGTDVLYEIAFESAGTKKLMATYAKLKRED